MRARKIDRNQPEIVDHLRRSGWRVHITSALGGGYPDLTVSRDGYTAVVEVKDGSLPESARRLTVDESNFRLHWRGDYVLALNPQDALIQLTRLHGIAMGRLAPRLVLGRAGVRTEAANDKEAHESSSISPSA